MGIRVPKLTKIGWKSSWAHLRTRRIRPMINELSPTLQTRFKYTRYRARGLELTNVWNIYAVSNVNDTYISKICTYIHYIFGKEIHRFIYYLQCDSTNEIFIFIRPHSNYKKVLLSWRKKLFISQAISKFIWNVAVQENGNVFVLIP